jgi:hypothetical protein
MAVPGFRVRIIASSSIRLYQPLINSCKVFHGCPGIPEVFDSGELGSAVPARLHKSITCYIVTRLRGNCSRSGPRLVISRYLRAEMLTFNNAGSYSIGGEEQSNSTLDAWQQPLGEAIAQLKPRK